MKSADPAGGPDENPSKLSTCDLVSESTAQLLNKLLVEGFVLKLDPVEGAYRIASWRGAGSDSDRHA